MAAVLSVSPRFCSVFQLVLQPTRLYSGSAGRKKSKKLPRESYMGPKPMIHEESPSHLCSRDFDLSLPEALEATNDSTNGYIKQFTNRNPRSGELIGIAEKPKGYKTRKWRIDYYHRLMLEVSSRHVSAYVNHNSGKIVVEASTKEFCISKHLYKTCDVSAAYNIGRVLAHRCTEMGLVRMIWEHKKNRHNRKVKAFMDGIHEGGIKLSEPRVSTQLPPPGTLA